MADIFISYARVDHGIAAMVAKRFKDQGYSVWWDTGATAGSNFRTEIVKELNAASTVIVLWTKHSTDSKWVLSEAQRALSQDKLVPLRSPDVDIHSIPPPFDTLHTPTIDEIPNSVRKTVKQNSKLIRMGQIRFWSLIGAICISSVMAGWFARQANIEPAKAVYSEPFIFTDALDNPKFMSLEAKGTWEGIGIKKGSTTVRLFCDRNSLTCEIHEAQISATGLFKNMLMLHHAVFVISKLNKSSLIAEYSFSECVRRSLTIDRISKTISHVRAKISHEGRCKFFQDEPLIQVLVDGVKSKTK